MPGMLQQLERRQLIEAGHPAAAFRRAVFHQPGLARGRIRRLVAEQQAKNTLRCTTTIEPLVAEREVVAVALIAGEGMRVGELLEEAFHLARHTFAAARRIAFQRDPACAALDAGTDEQL